MKTCKIKIRGKIIETEICNNIFSQARGLMFRKKSLPLLFIFKNAKKRAIHSLFCVPFRAIWFNKGIIVDEKFVKPWKLYIKPKKEFDKLLEIPEGDVTFK